jgi:regulator of RNase E activity RraA
MFIDLATDSCVIADIDWPRPAAELVAAYAAYPAANVGDALSRLGLMEPEIVPRTPDAHCVGPALTVLTREGDNLAIHRALDDACPGDVLVVNAFGESSRAVFGDLLAEVCLAHEVAGVVIDGAVRDVGAIAELGLPVWAKGVTPAGPSKHGPGQIGTVIACGRVVVAPGDLIVADSDGVAVVPGAACETVLGELERIARTEDAFRERVSAWRAQR